MTVSIYHNDHIQDVVERIQFVLNEMGIKMIIDDSDSEAVVYSFIQAERLGDAQKES